MLKNYQPPRVASRLTAFIASFVMIVSLFTTVLAPTAIAQTNDQTLNAASSADGWLDSAWQYRRSVTVNNTSTQPLTNHQVAVKLTANNFNFSRSSGDDIRFTDSDGVTLISHWVETYNTSAQTASLIVRVPQIAAASSKMFYMYYGNTSVANASSGSKTFDFFDGFERLRNAPAPDVTPTYDGSGQTVHPDVVYFANGWNGYKYWMATTPYPSTNDKLENPSILASNDGRSWVVPAGVINPLAATPPCDHNSDADMVYNDTTGELWMYYLDTRRASHCNGHQSQSYYNHNYLKLVKSSDGIHWSSPITVIDWNLNTEPLYVSPSVVKVGSTFYLWAVNSKTFTLRTSSGNGLSFGSSQAVNLNGQSAWHTDVEYIPSKNEYWMMFNYPSVPNGVIRFARSTNRTTWTTYSGAALSYTSNGWDRSLYRSTFVYDPYTNQIRLWYSANNGGTPLVWRTGQTLADYDEFLNGLKSAGGWTREQGSGAWSTSVAQAKSGVQSAQLTQVAGTSLIVSKPAPLANNFYFEWDMYDDMDSSAFKMARIANTSDNRLGVGVWTGASASRYVYHNKAYGYTVTSVPRTQGWHKFGIMLKANSSLSFFVDGQNVGTMSGQFNNATQLQVEGYAGGQTSFYIDNLRIRKWVHPEPAVVFGSEETT